MNKIKHILKGDIIKVISGSNKGKTGKVIKVLPKKQSVLVDGIGMMTRKVRPSRHNPRGGEKSIHNPIDISNVALVVDEKKSQTSRVGYKIGADKAKTRLARQMNDKEIAKPKVAKKGGSK